MNWGYDLAEGELAKKYDVGIVQASTLENKALPQDYVERLLSAYDPKVAQAYVHGLFINLSKGLVYYGFDRTESVLDLPMPAGAILGVGMDFNVNPMAATVFWAVPDGEDQHIHYFDEIELPNSDTQAMCLLLNETYSSPGIIRPVASTSPTDIVHTYRPLKYCFPDSNAGRQTNAPGGKTDYDYIEDAGFTIRKRARGNPNRRDRFNTVNGRLRTYKGRIRQTISPRCHRLIKYQMLYSHELMNREEQKSMSHLLDARDYPIVELFPADRETLRFKSIKGF